MITIRMDFKQIPICRWLGLLEGSNSLTMSTATISISRATETMVSLRHLFQVLKVIQRIPYYHHRIARCPSILKKKKNIIHQEIKPTHLYFKKGYIFSLRKWGRQELDKVILLFQHLQLKTEELKNLLLKTQ